MTQYYTASMTAGMGITDSAAIKMFYKNKQAQNKRTQVKTQAAIIKDMKSWQHDSIKKSGGSRVTYDTWHMTCDMWHIVGCEHSLKILAP